MLDYQTSNKQRFGIREVNENQKQMMFKLGDLVVGKVQNLPPWPGKITLAYNKSKVYKVKLFQRHNPVFLSQKNVESLERFLRAFESHQEVEMYDQCKQAFIIAKKMLKSKQYGIQYEKQRQRRLLINNKNQIISRMNHQNSLKIQKFKVVNTSPNLFDDILNIVSNNLPSDCNHSTKKRTAIRLFRKLYKRPSKQVVRHSAYFPASDFSIQPSDLISIKQESLQEKSQIKSTRSPKISEKDIFENKVKIKYQSSQIKIQNVQEGISRSSLGFFTPSSESYFPDQGDGLFNDWQNDPSQDNILPSTNECSYENYHVNLVSEIEDNSSFVPQNYQQDLKYLAFNQSKLEQAQPPVRSQVILSPIETHYNYNLCYSPPSSNSPVKEIRKPALFEISCMRARRKNEQQKKRMLFMEKMLGPVRQKKNYVYSLHPMSLNTYPPLDEQKKKTLTYILKIQYFLKQFGEFLNNKIQLPISEVMISFVAEEILRNLFIKTYTQNCSNEPDLYNYLKALQLIFENSLISLEKLIKSKIFSLAKNFTKSYESLRNGGNHQALALLYTYIKVKIYEWSKVIDYRCQIEGISEKDKKLGKRKLQ